MPRVRFLCIPLPTLSALVSEGVQRARSEEEKPASFDFKTNVVGREGTSSAAAVSLSSIHPSCIPDGTRRRVVVVEGSYPGVKGRRTELLRAQGEGGTTRPILDSTSKPRSTGSVKLTVRVNRVVFAGVGLMVVCPGRGILAQHQHQGSNQEEFSEGHFETKNYPQIPSR